MKSLSTLVTNRVIMNECSELCACQLVRDLPWNLAEPPPDA